MDGFRDRAANRYDRGERMDRGDRMDRMDRMDRGDYMDRDDRMDRASRRVAQSYGNGGYQQEADFSMVLDSIERNNARQLNAISDLFDDAKDDRRASEKEILRAVDDNASVLNEIKQNIMRQGREQFQPGVPAQSFDPAMKEELMQAIMSNTSLLNMIRQELAESVKQQASQEQPAEQKDDDANNQALLAALDDYFKNMEEHVHKENVKCYRNVQAALTEQGNGDTEVKAKGIGLITIFTIITTVLSVAHLALFILKNILEII